MTFLPQKRSALLIPLFLFIHPEDKQIVEALFDLMRNIEANILGTQSHPLPGFVSETKGTSKGPKQ